ncbi:MAG: hypothetical protein HY908_08930 [Myxococcales bacterium]|nr:hypothetical protein [Myxococcales bacterium]
MARTSRASPSSARSSRANEITSSLYFRNSTNNQGVFHTLVDTAEEEETKEAVLRYYFLLDHGGLLTKEELDGRVEAWFADRHRTELDFEVDDALAKLTRYGLVTQEGDRYRAVPLGEALALLDARWDGIFAY